MQRTSALPGELDAPHGAYFQRAERIGGEEGFYREGEHASLLYRARGPRLIVTFCNLASFEHPPEVRLPWLSHVAEEEGWSHLGVMAHRKDWYRNPGTPALLESLAEDRFFLRFDHVLFTGTSMGAFGALVYASVAPGADVLAFSPQSTLNTDLAPFETRYRWPRRKFDWTTPKWLDAADYVGASRRVVVPYDPMLPEDKAHVARLGGGPVEPLACRFMGHQMPNALKRAGVLRPLLAMAMGDGVDRGVFYRGFREGRRRMTDWRKSMARHAEKEGRTDRVQRICRLTMETHPGPWFRKTLERLDGDAGGGRA